MTSFVLGFAFSGDQVVLIRKTKPEWQRGKLNGLGGKIELGEYPEQAMAREFWEECGVIVPEDQWTQYVTMRSGRHMIYVFKTALGGLPGSFKQTDEGNVDTYHWQTVGLLGSALPNLAWLIPLALVEAGVRADVFYPHDPLDRMERK